MHLYNSFLEEKDGGWEGELCLLQKGEHSEKSLIRERCLKWLSSYTDKCASDFPSYCGGCS